ncbi:hypothetical protein M407DRAFT_215059 [Tulasnella calospora MUT 4182]|uniref:NAD-dependent epimerase/dehydratase domain-containing protein n=1 Tax=Tulasnella calospora MUT 4182 TaxID=1051891 RepID=A0A0C3QUP8_9AGAM|nr:hypothetical protein M407DRAFT_215059 [Tulasnella calospora MUT 4182]
MPAISSPAIILLTGVNGYIGAHIAQSLLTHGHTVRGVVRSQSKGDPLKELFKEYGDKFQLAVVPDVTALDAYDDAVKGVTGVVHASAPLPQQSITDVDDALRPAVDGTINLLNSVERYGTEVKRFILTSSAVTLLEPKEGEYTYTEADWFDTALKIVKAQGAKAHPGLIYTASKILQERAAFDFVEKKKDRLGFDLVALLPVYVLGPPVDAFVDTASLKSGSLGLMYNAFNDPDGKDWPDLISRVDVLVDVRDVAELHCRALVTEKVAGERFLLAGDSFHWQDAWDALNVEPKLPGAPIVTPGIGEQAKRLVQYSNKKSKETFSFEYRNNEEIIRDSWAEYLKRGWIEGAKA